MSVRSRRSAASEDTATSEDLHLYPGGFNLRGPKRKRAVAIVALVSLVVVALGFSGYRWVTTSTPVSLTKALQMFQLESQQGTAEPAPGERRGPWRNDEKKASPDKWDAKAATKGSQSNGGGSSANATTSTLAAASGETQSHSNEDKTSKARGDEYPTTPAEGVYSWDTDGWEEASGIRRQFPDESQRIITASDGRGWEEHHYFSEEREIWSKFGVSEKGTHLEMQRNRVRFGPVTNDSTIDFAPPMLGARANPEVGATWDGSWEGRTSGTYTAYIFDHGEMRIADEMVEVWGYEIRMQMSGELNGTVSARVMLAPKYALTVQEHYKQEIHTDRGRYRAQWTMTLKSTTPQR